MQPIKVTTLSACIAAIGFVPTVYAADNSTVILDTITVKGTRNKDEIGKNRVYAREVVNLYKSKEEVETFKGNTVSDLLSGMSGVYSGDARNSGALDPNIRGVQGQGRIPLPSTARSRRLPSGAATQRKQPQLRRPQHHQQRFHRKRPLVQPRYEKRHRRLRRLKTIDADDIVPEAEIRL